MVLSRKHHSTVAAHQTPFERPTRSSGSQESPFPHGPKWGYYVKGLADGHMHCCGTPNGRQSSTPDHAAYSTDGLSWC